MPRKLVTKKREKWAEARGATLKGTKLAHSIKNEDLYRRKLERLVAPMIRITKREILKLFKSDVGKKYYAQDASLASQARILLNKLQKDFEKIFSGEATGLAEGMLKRNERHSAKSLAQSLRTLSGGLSIKTSEINPELREMMKAASAQNVSLIKSIPSEYFKDITGAVMRSIENPQGMGLGEITKTLGQIMDKRGGITERRARMIAFDQTRKTYNLINQKRMEAVGIKKFQWIHSKSERNPRPLHLNVLDGQVFSFDDLPIIEEGTNQRGIPGTAINCRCVMKPIIEFD